MVIAAAVGMGFTAGPMADHQVRLVDESNPLAGRPFYVDPISVAMRAAKNNPDSPELAAQVRDQFERTTGPELSYHVVIEGKEGLVWYDRVKGKERRLEREPDASPSRRLGVTLLRVLPIDSLL